MVLLSTKGARLARLAKKTRRTKSLYIEQAIEDHLQVLEDLFLAQGIVARV